MVLVFDLSEVQIGGFDGIKKYISRDFSIDDSIAFEKRRKEVNDVLLDLFRGKIDGEDVYWNTFFDGQNFTKGLNPISAKYYLSECLYEKVPGTSQLIKSISSHPVTFGSQERIQGMPTIYIASDHIKERAPKIIRSHPEIFNLVKRSFWSFDLGCVKGDEEFFPQVIKAIDAPVEDIILIDDILGNNKSAERNGIRTILFEDAEKLRLELMKIWFTFV